MKASGNALINARSETIESRTAFREAFKHRRCLIPADSFYEWKEMHGERQPFRVMLKSGEPFCFAGLWDRWVKPPAAGKFDTDLDEAPRARRLNRSPSSRGRRMRPLRRCMTGCRSSWRRIIMAGG
jgi:hypothetical protein